MDRSGAVILLASGSFATDELLTVWKLAPGAGGWTRTGGLLEADVAEEAAEIEGGFGFGTEGPGAIAPDGSIHLFSNARCIGTGYRNRAQIYLRSRDGAEWSVERLPSADELTGQLTWKNVAFFAADYDRVRYITTSSTAPTTDGYTWHYPDRRYDVIERCVDSAGDVTFARRASARHPGWTVRGVTGFSDTGVATMITAAGLTQVR